MIRLELKTSNEILRNIILSPMCSHTIPTLLSIQLPTLYPRLRLFPMVANRPLSPKWGATAPLEADFPKIPHAKSNPMHRFSTQPTRCRGQNLAFGVKFGTKICTIQSQLGTSPNWVPWIPGFRGNSRDDWKQPYL